MTRVSLLESTKVPVVMISKDGKVTKGALTTLELRKSQYKIREKGIVKAVYFVKYYEKVEGITTAIMHEK
jgi:hypothetical protein